MSEKSFLKRKENPVKSKNLSKKELLQGDRTISLASTKILFWTVEYNPSHIDWTVTMFTKKVS